jgi:hypothetical protein
VPEQDIEKFNKTQLGMKNSVAEPSCKEPHNFHCWGQSRIKMYYFLILQQIIGVGAVDEAALLFLPLSRAATRLENIFM